MAAAQHPLDRLTPEQIEAIGREFNKLQARRPETSAPRASASWRRWGALSEHGKGLPARPRRPNYVERSTLDPPEAPP
jgi:hypothetical protein